MKPLNPVNPVNPVKNLAAPRRLFCWSGGGLPGLDIHTGIWRALTELGIESTANAGTSAGAIMAALNSSGGSPAKIELMLRGLSDDSVRDERHFWKIRSFWIDWFLSHAPIRKVLERLLPSRFLGLPKPLSIFATHVADGKQTVFGTAGHLPLGLSLIDAVLASMSISGVFPYVRINGQDYADGGPRANLPLPDNWREYSEIYLLIASPPVDYKKRSGIISRMLLNVDWYALDQIEDVIELAQYEEKRLRGPKCFVVWPDIGRAAGALRFRHEFIDQAYQETKKVFLTG